MNNRQDEIKIAIESKAIELSKLMEEYDSNGGKPVYLLMTRFDDEDTHNISARGLGEDIKDLLFANEDINTLIIGGALERIMENAEIEVREDEEWAKASRITTRR